MPRSRAQTQVHPRGRYFYQFGVMANGIDHFRIRLRFTSPASSSGYCSRELNHNSKVVYFLYRFFIYKNVFSELKLNTLNILQESEP